MLTESVDAKQLFTSLDAIWSELLKLISSTAEEKINIVPFTGSWTVAQLATHIIKSNRAIAQGLQMQGTPADRNPEEGVPRLKKMFLDFTVKFQSPAFIVPEEKSYSKTSVTDALRISVEQLKEYREKANLVEIINLPVFGEITKLELLHFVLYHTQRHVHQLKGMMKTLEKSEVD